MLNPLTPWEPGTAVHYHGSLTELHGHYHAYPCTCLRCDDPNTGSVRFELLDQTDTIAVSCVRARSITPANDAGTDNSHDDCIGPHRDSSGEYIDCDGRPL
ncbi:hypothetical protein [Streptomyces sp. ISBFB 2968]|uniref:hypothetical protein n=1 Tax=Streptomyces sp. ISBFB 2968 TaxID=2903527 RepID=UPI002FDC4D46